MNCTPSPIQGSSKQRQQTALNPSSFEEWKQLMMEPGSSWRERKQRLARTMTEQELQQMFQREKPWWAPAAAAKRNSKNFMEESDVINAHPQSSVSYIQSELNKMELNKDK